jgi:transposase InsO family protein
VRYLGAADVLAIPDTVTDITASPLKLFEYLALGQPLVLPAMASLQEIVPPELSFVFPRRSLDGLEQALYARQPERTQALVHHSDRGSQYVSIRYTERLAEAGIKPSVGSRGDSYDNALAETINGLYKAELIHRRAPWKTKAAVELATLEWVSWFNHHRLLEPIGYIPPAEAEANYYRQLAEEAAPVA